MMSKYTSEFERALNDNSELRSEAVNDLSILTPRPYNSSARRAETDGHTEPAKRRPFVWALKIAALVLLVVGIGGGIGGYFYWQSLKSKPQYSLALLIEAARNDDQAAVSKLIDTDAAVDNFVPQVTAKAIELYGRGLPPQTLARVQGIATPLMPAVKDRAREALPRLIREKTARFESVPFAGMVMGAEQYLDINENGNEATVASKLPEHVFEFRMTRSGDRWKIVGIRDDKLATSIAQRIGQEIIAIANNSRDGKTSQSSNLRNIQDVLREAQEIFK